MKKPIIILLGIALLVGGIVEIQNVYYAFICCFLGGALIGVGFRKSID